MARYITKRVLRSLITMFIIITILFALLRLMLPQADITGGQPGEDMRNGFSDRQGNLIGVQNRNLDYSKTADVPRFRFPRGARCSIYNLPVVNRLKAGDELFITEGCSDCWAMLSSGRKAIAIPSATLLSQEDRETLRSLSREKSVSFHMFPDCDAPGESLFMQLRDVLPGLVHHQLLVGCKDFGEAYSLEEKSQELRS